jgi:hypothetical protein
MATSLFPEIERAAQLSPCGQYRYTLDRQWDDGRHVTFLMFNPSTADANVDDHTIRKCMGFGKRWGYGRMTVINLFAIRSTDPRAVERAADAVGPLNDYWITKTLESTRELVCAWGCEQHMRTLKSRNRVAEVRRLASVDNHPLVRVVCLGRTQGGTPRHPLMLPYDTERVEF